MCICNVHTYIYIYVCIYKYLLIFIGHLLSYLLSAARVLLEIVVFHEPVQGRVKETHCTILNIA